MDHLDDNAPQSHELHPGEYRNRSAPQPPHGPGRSRLQPSLLRTVLVPQHPRGGYRVCVTGQHLLSSSGCRTESGSVPSFCRSEAEAGSVMKLPIRVPREAAYRTVTCPRPKVWMPPPIRIRFCPIQLDNSHRATPHIRFRCHLRIFRR